MISLRKKQIKQVTSSLRAILLFAMLSFVVQNAKGKSCESLFVPIKHFPSIRFGFEPQAYNHVLMTEASPKYITQLQKTVAAQIVAAIPGSKISGQNLTSKDYHSQGIDIQTPTGKIHVGADAGYIEIQPYPMFLEQVLAANAPIYKAFKASGLSTVFLKKSGKSSWGSGMHIHVEKTVFEESPLLLRNLLVDFHNRPYIDAIFKKSDDVINAMTYYEVSMQGELVLLISEIDRRAALAGAYSFSEMMSVLRDSPIGSNRYFGINLTNLAQAGRIPTVEFRFMTGQSSELDLFRQAQFLEKYLRHLNTLNQPLSLHLFDSFHEFETLRSPTKAIAAFQKLAATIGLRADEYGNFISNRYTVDERQVIPFGESEAVTIEIRIFDNRPSWTNASLQGAADGIGTWFEIVVKDPSGRIKKVNLYDRKFPTISVDRSAEKKSTFRSVINLHEPRKDRSLFGGKVEGLDDHGNVIFESPLEFKFEKYSLE